MKGRRFLKGIVTHLDKVPPARFSALLFRDLFPSPLAGRASVVHESLAASAKLPAVLHRRTDELVFCIRGKAAVILDGRRYTLRPGSLVWIPRNSAHRFISKSRSSQSLSVFFPALDFKGRADVHEVRDR